MKIWVRVSLKKTTINLKLTSGMSVPWMWGSFLYTVQAGKNNTWIKLIIYQVLFSTVLLILVAIVPCPPPGNLPNPGIEPTSPAVAGRFSTIWAIWEDKILPLEKKKETLKWWDKLFWTKHSCFLGIFLYKLKIFNFCYISLGIELKDAAAKSL